MTIRNKGPKTQRTNGNLSRKNTAPDKIGALVMNAIAVVGGLQLGTTYKLTGSSDITDVLKVNAAYDTTNDLLVNHHLTRFFLRNPGATLFVLFAPQKVSTTHQTLALLADKDQNYAKKLLNDMKPQLETGQVVSLGICANPAADYTPTIANGIDNTVPTAVAKAQELAELMAEDYLFVNVWVEGRAFSGTVGDLVSLRTSGTAPRVSVVLAADPAVMAADSRYEDYAAIGDVVGLDTLAALSQNVGELTEALNLQNDAQGAFLSAGLSGNNLVSAFADPADAINDLDDLGYVVCEQITGYAGIYLSDSHTCVPITNDYSFKEANYVIDKAQLLRRNALLPLTTNARLQADPATGELSATAKAGLQQAVNKAIEDEMSAEISGGVDSYIPPGINVLAGEEIVVECSFVPLVIGRRITIKSGFSNPFNA
jgi:hypothetical protein